MKTKAFPTLAVLTITSERFVVRPISDHDNGIDVIYRLLGWMTNDQPFTHQLPRFTEECRPWLERWFPDLAAATNEIVRRCEAGEVDGLQDMLEQRFGLTREVPKIPQDDHERKHPLQELREMCGEKAQIILLEDEPPCAP